MLNFDPERYLRIQRGALSAGAAAGEVVDQELARGVEHLFFLGAGGAGMLMAPAAELLAAGSTIGVTHIRGAELVANGSPLLGPEALCIVPSLSGTTPDALAHIEYVRSRGARVLALVGHEDTPVAQAADHTVVNFAADDTSCESFYLQSQAIALAVMDARGESAGLSLADYEAALAQLPEDLLGVKELAEAQAPELAAALAASDYHVMTGAGAVWTEAHYYAMCILEEMQWIRTRPVHASDFFHGTLELVEPGVSTWVLTGEGPSRELSERVTRFAQEHTDQLVVLDSAAYPTPHVPDVVRPLISHVILAAVLERFSAHLEVLRDHPLTTRRYYRKLAY